MNQDNATNGFQSGAQLLAEWNATTREAKLERACMALMEQLESVHEECKEQSLKDNLTNPEIYCSCSDAYRMGEEALKV